MKTQPDEKCFDDICQQYSTWIIKYSSIRFSTPVFLIWYTNTDGTDRLLTYKNGRIAAFGALDNLKNLILSNAGNLSVFANLHHWLDKFCDLEVKEYVFYDLALIENKIGTNLEAIRTLEGIVNFINLYGDYAYQDTCNAHLHAVTDDRAIRETVEYYYDYVFWPRFSNPEAFEKGERPALEANTAELLTKLKVVIGVFDEHIDIQKSK